MVIFIKGGASIGYAYAQGEKAELSAAIEAELVETKFCQYIEETEKATSKPKVEKAVKK